MVFSCGMPHAVRRRLGTGPHKTTPAEGTQMLRKATMAVLGRVLREMHGVLRHDGIVVAITLGLLVEGCHARPFQPSLPLSVMPSTHLDAPLFIQEIHREQVDIVGKPYFFNDGGKPRYCSSPPPGAELLQPAVTDPSVAMGNEYQVPRVVHRESRGTFGLETQLAFAAEQVEFAPLWATREAAAAFGITLVEPGQVIEVRSPVAKLEQIEYEYGVFAGHWSPYQDTKNTLLSVVCTDLEHHNFPHVFASTDPTQPLVTTVGRYWPGLGKIRLADLWVPRGSALYIPPMPANSHAPCIDLHGNRQSAHACWGNIHQNSVRTHTLLQDKGGYFYWYWNAIATVHGRPTPMG